MQKPIDQIKTGIKLKILLKQAGYDVKFVQEYLHLSCPQSIYRWFRGKVLPSVEHLCALSKLLNVHMEELLVLEGDSLIDSLGKCMINSSGKRLLAYVNCFHNIA